MSCRYCGFGGVEETHRCGGYLEPSNKEGIRIVLELKKDADIEKIKNILYKKTKLEDTFGVNMLAIAGSRPETLTLKGILKNTWISSMRIIRANTMCFWKKSWKRRRSGKV